MVVTFLRLTYLFAFDILSTSRKEVARKMSKQEFIEVKGYWTLEEIFEAITEIRGLRDRGPIKWGAILVWTRLQMEFRNALELQYTAKVMS
jgi:hypothetical protein